jgi:segregation and condensation protein A
MKRDQKDDQMSAEPRGRALSTFTVELDVYSGPYEGLLALILKHELEIFEVPLRELVSLYRSENPPGASPGEEKGALERDTDFVYSATSLVLLKGRSLAPVYEDKEEETDEVNLYPQELEERLVTYLKVKRAAEALGERLKRNADLFPSAHTLHPRPRRLRLGTERLAKAVRRAFLRTAEPEVRHLGPITVTVDELVTLIRTSLVHGALSFEDFVRGMDRLRSAVAFAAALSLASEGHANLSQAEPFGPLTIEPANERSRAPKRA